MKSSIRIFILIFVVNIPVISQIDTVHLKRDTTTAYNKWIPGGVIGLNINQVAFKDWATGGENSLSASIFTNFSLDYLKKKWSLLNELKMTFGESKAGSTPFRITDNEFFLEDIFIYRAGWFADPYVSNNVRTVLANGYDYSATPSVQVAAFFDPGYVTQGTGLRYSEIKGFTTRLGFAVRETFTSKFIQYSDDTGTHDKVEKFKIETGIESISEAKFVVAKNLLFSSRLDLFSQFKTLNVWDVRWDNTICAQVNKFINVNLNVLVLYMQSVSLRTQIKEGLQLGVIYTFF
ncbi:MAG: DUF3078 domain-containing protein [Ignavibacteria bacterium]